MGSTDIFYFSSVFFNSWIITITARRWLRVGSRFCRPLLPDRRYDAWFVTFHIFFFSHYIPGLLFSRGFLLLWDKEFYPCPYVS